MIYLQNINNKRKVTLKDIAELAGVSKTTASLALNKGVGSERISQETREKIEKIAKELKYEVNYMGIALKRQSTMQIALAIPTIYHPFMPEMIRGVEETLRKKGYNIMLLDFTNQNEQDIVSSINKLENGSIDGLLSFAMGNEIVGNLKQDTPIVHIDESDYTPSVRFDSEGAAKELTQYFINKGIKKIAFIGADSNKSTYIAREKGYIETMEKAGLSKWTHLITHVEVSYKGGYSAYKWLTDLNSDEKPEAIVVNTDIIAHALMFNMIKEGIRIPEDVLIGSIDDVELSEIMVPSLTCVRVPAYEMGVRASEMLLDILNGKDLDGKVDIIPTELIIRETSERI